MTESVLEYQFQYQKKGVQSKFKLITSNSGSDTLQEGIISDGTPCKIIPVWENNSNIALFVLAVIFRLANKPLIWLLHEVISRGQNPK